ncbi:uncharacterized protein K452DRAFT_299382 [Aplosporella prunicola CBS 121167]|uniref:Uncharacterized protein n=1 Tax=Aplosporella prunicola CBS 121167 TaxID=1176127 RepID=A0A6A6B8S8_9PEZI|nr:uncharacterized protein K452DRAFT_299382 [Aplosporella prunicola CBS 121167]KAF2140652.1 hypothetical protein K452DRAFT_299382 [Aplosporella prunicola CBS 121167]
MASIQESPPARAPRGGVNFTVVPAIDSIDSELGLLSMSYADMSTLCRLPMPLRKFAQLWEDGGRLEFGEYQPRYAKIGADRKKYGTHFGACVDLQTSLENFEDDIHKAIEIVPEYIYLIHFMYSNWQLYQLQQGTALKYHPILPYWVSTVLRWDDKAGFGLSLETGITKAPPKSVRIRVARYIKHILTVLQRSVNDPTAMVLPPAHPRIREGKDDLTPNFDISYFVNVLDEQGVPWRSWYERMLPDAAISLNLANAYPSAEYYRFHLTHLDNESILAAAKDNPLMAELDSAQQDSQDTIGLLEDGSVVSPDASFPTSAPPRKEIDNAGEITQLARHDSMQAQQILVNLPIDVKSMEIINTILAAQATNNATVPPLDKTVIASGYIQHGLRSLERTPSDATSPLEPYSPADDPAEKARKVRLLVLFLKNLVKRNLVPPGDLNLDMQEICVRYAAIKEVRDFRHWLETGEE